MMRALKADVRRYRSDFPRRHLTAVGLLMRRAGLQALVVYRLGQWLQAPGGVLRRLLLAPVRWLVYAPAHVLVACAYGIDLDISAELGPGLYIGHVGGIDIRQCRLGAHCSIAQQTRIGPAARGIPGPTVGDHVWIGAHAQVLGPLLIGHGATIAAAARVVRDVPPRALVAGNPARVVKWGYDNTVILGDAPGRPPLAGATPADCVPEHA